MRLLLALLTVVSALPLLASDPYREPHRPQFHFTPEKNWMNDPNGMFYYDGEYHLFYQYNPFGDRWGHMSWGHAVSPDLLHWQHLPLALPEQDGVMIFSGSAVVDWKNTSGLGQGGRPPLVAIYTGHYTERPLQNQHIAYSNDRGRTWTKYAGNPVLDLGEKDFRDPKVFWHAATTNWVMTVSWPQHRQVRFYSSPNLKEWTHQSDFGPAGATNGIWECPDLFPLRLGGHTRWVLIVNVGSDAIAGGSGCQYFVGDFDGHRFVPDPSLKGPQWVDHGPDFYAAVSWGDVPKSDGRRLWLGWMSNWQYANDVPTSPWRSAMSIPRELSLRATPVGPRLVQRPVAELARLRGAGQRFGGGDVLAANAWARRAGVRGDTLEIEVELPSARTGRSGVKVLQGATTGVLVGVDRDRGTVFVDRTRSGEVGFHKKFPAIASAPLESPRGPVRLRILVDAMSVEVFANDGERVVTALALPPSDAKGVEFFGTEVDTRIGKVTTWPLRSTWR